MTDWRAVWAVYAAGLAAGAHLTKVPPALPALRDAFGLTLVESGFIATMFNVMGMTVGMVAGVLPVVGVTLPLVSYGGSSLLTIMIALGLLMSVSIRRYTY